MYIALVRCSMCYQYMVHINTKELYVSKPQKTE